MPTIYLKQTTFNKLCEAGHYNDYEEVIDHGVELALMEERTQPKNRQELFDMAALHPHAGEIPNSEPGPLPPNPESVEKPGAAPNIVQANSETIQSTTPTEICLRCNKPIMDPSNSERWSVTVRPSGKMEYRLGHRVCP